MKVDDELYLRSHSEIGVLLKEIMCAVLEAKPSSPIQFLTEYFAHYDIKTDARHQKS